MSFRRLPLAGGWTSARDMPAPEGGTFVERWHKDRLRYMRKHHGLLGTLCARLGTTWAFAAWGLRRVFFRVRDPFWERVGSYIRFLRA